MLCRYSVLLSVGRKSHGTVVSHDDGFASKYVLRIPTRSRDAAAHVVDGGRPSLCGWSAGGQAEPARARRRRAVGSRALVEFQLDRARNAHDADQRDVAFMHKGRSADLLDVRVKKGKVFPYSLPSVGPGADPGVQAVSPQVT